MAVLVFTNAKVSINSTSLSNHVRSVSLEYSSELLDATAMGTAATRTRVAGFKDWTFTIEFLQDFAASSVDATLFPLVGTSFTIKVRPVNTSVAATNPEYNGTGMLENYPIFGGGVGDVATASCNVRAAGALSRSTT
jgi:hypothetical protein